MESKCDKCKNCLIKTIGIYDKPLQVKTCLVDMSIILKPFDIFNLVTDCNKFSIDE